MFAESYQFNKRKNKWQSQRIHKEYNRIQHASKHYGKYNNIIFKRKDPLKQRKDRKKFKIQRKRKKYYKEMSFDYEDFISNNKNENFGRIQIRPTIQYRIEKRRNIELLYNNYFYPNNKYKTEIDCISVNMLFYVKSNNDMLITKSNISQQTILPIIKATVNVYNNYNILDSQTRHQKNIHSLGRLWIEDYANNSLNEYKRYKPKKWKLDLNSFKFYKNEKRNWKIYYLIG
eukprot:436198_1